MSKLILADMTPVDRYRLLIGAVVPRPIAWVTTLGIHEVVNLAPFSFFQGVTATPATLMVCISHREPEKDTLVNLRHSGEAVVHLVPPGALDAMHISGAEYPPEQSEVLALGLETIPSDVVRPPRLSVAQVAFECRVTQCIPVGTPATTMVLLEALVVHLDNHVVDAEGLPEATRLRTVARLGGQSYLNPDSWTTIEKPRLRRPPSLK